MSVDLFAAIDPILMPWADKHGLKVAKIFRDDPVRLITLYDRRTGKERAQISLWPTTGNQIAVGAAFCPSPNEQPQRDDRTVPLDSLEATLEELRILAFKWAGPGAFSG